MNLKGHLTTNINLEGKLNNLTVTVYPPLENLEVTPSLEEQIFTHQDSYGYDTVTVNEVTSNIDNNIIPSNIKKDVEILGVIGSYEGESPILQNKTVTPSLSEQVISADSGYDGLGEVTINAVTNSIDNNIIPENIKKDVEILGVTGTYEGSGGGTTDFIEVGDNLRNKTVFVSLDYSFEDSRNSSQTQYILFNNNTIEDAENDSGDFIRKDDYIKSIMVGLYEDESDEYNIFYNNKKVVAGFKFPNDKDYIITYIDESMSEIFEIGYLNIDDFEFEKVSSDNIIPGITISGVEGNAQDEFDKFLQGTLASSGDYENPRITSLPNGMFSGSSFDSFNGVVSFPNVTQMGSSTFYPANNITGLELPKLMSNTSASYIIMNCVKLKYIYTPDWVVNCSGPMRR